MLQCFLRGQGGWVAIDVPLHKQMLHGPLSVLVSSSSSPAWEARPEDPHSRSSCFLPET